MENSFVISSQAKRFKNGVIINSKVMCALGCLKVIGLKLSNFSIIFLMIEYAFAY